MLDNNIIQNKKFDRAKVIYILVFFAYSTLAIVIFIYSLQFLTQTMNAAFSTPQTSEMEAKYGQLHLAEYALVADKLDLKAPLIPLISEQNTPSEQTPSSERPVAAPLVENTQNNLPLDINLNQNPIIPEIAPRSDINNTIPNDQPVQNANLNIKPIISVINSTLTTGLAASLKNDLQKSGLDASLGNIRPAAIQTIIKVKNSYNQGSEYFTEIKKIVSAKYDFVIESLDETTTQDIQIIIGNK